jgi:hypothetical protein
MRAPAIRVVLYVLPCLVSSLLAAQEIPNWTVPPYAGARPAGQLSTMTDTSPGIAFVAMSPCRVFDTRNANGAYGGPRLLANVTRNFDIDSGPCTGIPAGVDAYSMNFGAILADGIGFVTIWPTGVAQPTVSSINTIPGYVLANAAIVPAGTNGSISVFPNTGMHLYGDINGYFADRYNPGVSFHAVSTNVAPAILAENTSTDTNASAVQAVITSTSAGDFATAVYARTNGNGYGVHGSSANGYGVLAGGGAGGVWATTSGSGSGVYGQNTGSGYGVYGKSTSGGSGVFGVGPTGSALASSFLGPAGVRGEERDNYGVLGLSQHFGVAGFSIGSDGFTDALGYLGANFLGDVDYGVFAGGNYGGTGAKYFVEPHPQDPSLVIRYISLEGNESGTYFRGRGKFQNGLAKIKVPEDFRLVTDSENLSVVVTPIGEMASFAVVKIDLDEIVVKSSRNVEFFYIVNGVRKSHKHLTPIGPGREYMPDSSGTRMPIYLTDGQRQMLISNGTYNADGTVNMETARRLGWDKEWEKRSRPQPQPASD